MAVIANRKVDLLPGWSLQAGERLPEKVWDGLGKAKQRVLLAGRFFLLKHGKQAEAVPAAQFNAERAVPVPPVVTDISNVSRETDAARVWPEYRPVKDTSPSLRELVGAERPADSSARSPLVCADCGYEAASKQALGGHRRGHAKQKARQLASV